ncbi:hypothetical protein TELCIR_17077 [Teladorsagia circumcincta]|uniref:Uncharacterized protein n=1 Tax=Teladorsagia circumcincta TaxID=45464 RepID=A0A2G9TVF0_TELCI|nr:hypothetical protein TELCIR_17077 [Teladorsagia circumcincta]
MRSTKRKGNIRKQAQSLSKTLRKQIRKGML